MAASLLKGGISPVSAVAINGQEDDDFAYEDEHIELESENQEYDDLTESEFVEKQPSAIRAEAKSPAAPVTAPPRPSGLKPAIAQADSNPKPTSSSQAAGPSTRTTSGSSSGSPPSRPPADISGIKRRSKMGAGRKKQAADPKKKAGSVRKAVTRPQAKKKKQPAQKKSVAKRAKVLPVKKAAARKAAPVRKKTPKSALKKAKRSSAARTKRRKA
jgi:hypothetical protein